MADATRRTDAEQPEPGTRVIGRRGLLIRVTATAAADTNNGPYPSGTKSICSSTARAPRYGSTVCGSVAMSAAPGSAGALLNVTAVGAERNGYLTVFSAAGPAHQDHREQAGPRDRRRDGHDRVAFHRSGRNGADKGHVA